MKDLSLKGLLLTGALLFALSAQAQLELPRKSPKASVSYTVGLTEITINYSAPAVREREIWGKLVPYDKVWRAGANEATTMEFSTDIIMEGEKLPAGKYSFFLIPREEGTWTAIFNKVADQWGAYNYDESQDALRVEVKPQFKKVNQERLNYAIVDRGPDKGYIRLSWEKARVYLRFQVNYLEQALANVEKALQESPEDRKWQVYAAGADFLLEEGKELDKALEWAAKSTELFSHSWNWWVRARAEAANGNYKAAIQAAEKAKAASEANEKDNYYDEIVEEVQKAVAEWSAKS